MQSFTKFEMSRIDSIRELLKKDPEDVFLNYALAMEYMSAEQTDEAIEKLEWIRKKQADYLPLYYQLAQLYAENGAGDKSEQIYLEGIEVAEAAGDRKTASELRSALEELLF